MLPLKNLKLGVYILKLNTRNFSKVFIDGKRIVDGADIEVNKGDRFTLLVQIKGGRGDFVQFPDTYADLGANAKIVSRGYNKLYYKKDEKECKWELINEKIEFESDDKIKLDINSELTNKHQAAVFIPAGKVEKSYIKVTIQTNWEFTDGSSTKQEINEAQAVIRLKIKGNSNEWFASPNVKATGTKHPVVEQMLIGIQESYQKIEMLFNLISSSFLTYYITLFRSLIPKNHVDLVARYKALAP